MNEVVPAKDRGPLVDIHGAVFQVGFAMSSWVGYGFYFMTSKTIDTWRAPLGMITNIQTLLILCWNFNVQRKIPLEDAGHQVPSLDANLMTAFQCLPPLITLAILPLLPESPRWLLLNDKVEEARQVLLRSHSVEESAIELSQIHSQMQVERSLNNSYLHMLRKPSYRKRAILAICTCFMANCSGILVVNSECTSAVSFFTVTRRTEYSTGDRLRTNNIR